ncbi:hypothetical protein Thiowin_03030 [Thiorhodovibrio winogradskyi]|uniref:C2H2-type domain-containing protein n=1 Tax=Thiorhodovibrio winogradskyi TaxID=77007 RepID=A0ABZ0SCY8_9GAMM
MKRRRRRKCLHCGELFHPDARNVHHQRYCGKGECRRASKAASQRRWLDKAANRDYFRGPSNVERVRDWRAKHPGYARARPAQGAGALQEDCAAQVAEINSDSEHLNSNALQDLLGAQEIVLIGLIANLTGSALQEAMPHAA